MNRNMKTGRRTRYVRAPKTHVFPRAAMRLGRTTRLLYHVAERRRVIMALSAWCEGKKWTARAWRTDALGARQSEQHGGFGSNLKVG